MATPSDKGTMDDSMDVSFNLDTSVLSAVSKKKNRLGLVTERLISVRVPLASLFIIFHSKLLLSAANGRGATTEPNRNAKVQSEQRENETTPGEC